MVKIMVPNPISKWDDLGGFPIFLETPMWTQSSYAIPVQFQSLDGSNIVILERFIACGWLSILALHLGIAIQDIVGVPELGFAVQNHRCAV